MGENREIFGTGEQSRMSGYAAKHARIFILHFALNEPVPKVTILSRWRNRLFQSWSGIERRTAHAERAKNFALAKDIEGLVGEPLEGKPEQDESDVAVFGARSGGGSQRSGECRLQYGVPRFAVQKKLFVSRQAGAMGEQHVQRYLTPEAAITRSGGKFRNNGGYCRLKVKQSPLIKNHCHGSRGDDLGERREIKNARRGDVGRPLIVGEAAESLACDEFALKTHRERAGGERLGGNGILKNAKGAGKPLVLRGEISQEERKARFSIRQRRVQGYL